MDLIAKELKHYSFSFQLSPSFTLAVFSQSVILFRIFWTNSCQGVGSQKMFSSPGRIVIDWCKTNPASEHWMVYICQSQFIPLLFLVGWEQSSVYTNSSEQTGHLCVLWFMGYAKICSFPSLLKGPLVVLLATQLSGKLREMLLDLASWFPCHSSYSLLLEIQGIKQVLPVDTNRIPGSRSKWYLVVKLLDYFIINPQSVLFKD